MSVDKHETRLLVDGSALRKEYLLGSAHYAQCSVEPQHIAGCGVDRCRAENIRHVGLRIAVNDCGLADHAVECAPPRFFELATGIKKRTSFEINSEQRHALQIEVARLTNEDTARRHLELPESRFQC